MMKTAELRKLIRAHNILSKITIPKGSTAEEMVKLIEAKNYTVDHVKKEIRPLNNGKTISLENVSEILPKPKTKAEREEAKTKRDKVKQEKVKVQKKKELDIKAEGVKQGATLQRLIARKKATKSKPAPKPAPKLVKKEEKTGGATGPVTAGEKLKKSSDDLKKKWRTFPFTDKQIKKLDTVVPNAKFLNIYENRKGTPFGLAVDGIKYKFNKPLQDETVSEKTSDNSQALSQANEFWDSLKDLKWTENVRSKILKLFNKGRMGFEDYITITNTKTQRGFLIISWVYQRKRAEFVANKLEDDPVAREKEIKKLMTIPQTSKFKIPVE